MSKQINTEIQRTWRFTELFISIEKCEDSLETLIPRKIPQYAGLISP